MCPAAKKGDIRLFLMNGRPLEIDGKYAALRRVAAKDDIRSNIHAGGTAEAVEIGKVELEVAEIIRPKLMADGMFLVGVDIVGDKILEVNVFSPGNLHSCSRAGGRRFFGTDPGSDRAQGRDQVAICPRVRQPPSGDPLIPGPAANREWAKIRFRPIPAISEGRVSTHCGHSLARSGRANV